MFHILERTILKFSLIEDIPPVMPIGDVPRIAFASNREAGERVAARKPLLLR